jgi:hypothetical protein
MAYGICFSLPVLSLVLSLTTAILVDTKEGVQPYEFSHKTAAFGPQPGNYDVSGAAVFISDSCNIQTSLINKIMVTIRNDNCPFSHRVLMAQQVGAEGVVIGNNDTSNPEQLLLMSEDSADTSSQFNIPAVFVSTTTVKGLIQLLKKGSISITLNTMGELTSQDSIPRNRNADILSLVGKSLLIGGPILIVGFCVYQAFCARRFQSWLHRRQQDRRNQQQYNDGKIEYLTVEDDFD